MAYEIRRVTALTDVRSGYVGVTLDDGSAAYALVGVVGEPAVGDEVVVDTTAIELGLGTGGAHVVHANLTQLRSGAPDARSPKPALGYRAITERDQVVVKARYLSEQVAVVASRTTDGELPLAGVRVLLCGLHSYAMAAVAVAHDVGAGFSYAPADTSDSGEGREPPALRRRVAYVMTDGGALPFAMSALASELVARDLLAATVSAGQSFGAGIEAVNVVDGVAAAKAQGIRRVVVAAGPGHVGTANRYGFSGLDLAGHAAVLTKLGATVALCVRASSTDGRDRHRGVSHHTRTLAGLLPKAATVVLPDVLSHGLSGAAGGAREVVVRPGDVAASLARHQLDVTSMGGRLVDDQLACACIGAAGRWLAQGEAAVGCNPAEALRRGQVADAGAEAEADVEQSAQQLAQQSAELAPDAGEPAAEQLDAEQPDAEQPQSSLRSRFARQVGEWALVIVLTLGLSLGLRAVVVGAFYIPSTSMEPALTLGTRVLMNRLAYISVSPQRGDVVVFGSPEAVGSYAPAELIKRVVAVAGDSVEGRGGHVYVNGARTVEPYLAEPASTSDFGPVRVPDDHVFMLGDNRRNSQDSRAFGPVPLEDVRGRAFARYWPPSNIGGL